MKRVLVLGILLGVMLLFIGSAAADTVRWDNDVGFFSGLTPERNLVKEMNMADAGLIQPSPRSINEIYAHVQKRDIGATNIYEYINPVDRSYFVRLSSLNDVRTSADKQPNVNQTENFNIGRSHGRHYDIMLT